MFPRSPLAMVLAMLAAALLTMSSGCGASGPSTEDVERTRSTLDARAATAPDTVVSWGVENGVVVVRVAGERTPEVDRFVAGLDPATLRIETGAPPVRLFPGS